MGNTSSNKGLRLNSSVVRIESWGPGDFPLLEAVLGRPSNREPENPEKFAERQARYQKPDSCQYKIVDVASGEEAGYVGYWEREWQINFSLRCSTPTAFRPTIPSSLA
jgi:hypothetical protein